MSRTKVQFQILKYSKSLFLSLKVEQLQILVNFNNLKRQLSHRFGIGKLYKLLFHKKCNTW